jgi:type III secretion protein J
MRRTRILLRWLLAALSLTLLAGCARQEIYGQLTERQANEMVAVLRNAGLPAHKEKRDKQFFALTTSNGEFARAVELLHAAGYPRDEHQSLGEVFKKEGFVSTPLEERARFMHALSQELSATIGKIDGVLVARVHLAVPEKDPLSDKPKNAAASVFIKHRAGMDLTNEVGRIKALVVNGMEGLPYEAVTVVTFPAERWPAAAPAAALQAAPAPLRGLDTPLLASAGLGGTALLLGGGWWVWQRRRPLRPSRSDAPRPNERSATSTAVAGVAGLTSPTSPKASRPAAGATAS